VALEKTKFDIYFIFTVIFIATLVVIVFIVQARTNNIVSELTLSRAQTAKQELISYFTELEERAMLRAELIASRQSIINSIKNNDYYTLKKDLLDFSTGIDIASICNLEEVMVSRSNTDISKENIFEKWNIASVLQTGSKSNALVFSQNNILAACASAPVYDKDKLIGVISCSFDLYKNQYLDNFKKRTGCEATIFIDSKRIASTIMDQSGNRIIGTKADDIITEAIYKENKDYYLGILNIFNKQYGVHYSPLIIDDQIIGMLFVGVNIDSPLARQRAMNFRIFIVSLLGFIMAIVFVVVSNIYTRRYTSTFQELSEKTTSLNIMEKMLQSVEAQILITDIENDNIIFLNEKMKTAFDLTEDVKGKKCWEFFQVGLNERCSFCPKRKQEIYSNESVFWEEQNPITGRYYRIISRIIDWPDGSKVYLQQRDDITELRNIIAKVQEADERMKLMLDTSPNGISFFDEDFNCLDCNQSVMDMFKISDKKEYLTNFSKFSPKYQPTGENSDEMRHKYLTTAFEKGYCRFDWTHQRPGGELVPCTIVAIRSIYKGQNVVIAHMHDLRELKASIELKATIEHMREVEEHTQLLLDATPLSCTLWNKDLNIVYCNMESLKLFGIKNKEDFGNKLFETLSPEFQPCGGKSTELGRMNLKRAFEEGYCRFEWLHQMQNGEPLPSEVTLVRGHHGGEDLVAAYVRDLREHIAYVAEINKTQENLRLARDTSEAANQAKSAFLASMSHEIRTPMNSIIGFSELAQDDNLSFKTREYLEKISENAKWLLNIINDILDISKIESGRMSLENIPFRLHDIFTHCQTLIMPKTVEKGLSLYCYAESSIAKILIGDPVRLRQSLINLLSNAVKFTHMGTIKLLASIVSSNEKRATIRFEVKDSGIGMTSEQIERSLQPFMQADASISRKYGGTGLGLAITKNFIEMMGGKLEVESKLNVGSKFSFELTFDIVDEPADMLTHKNVFNEIKKPNFEGEILICEDNSMNQQVICEHLARVGLNAIVAQNGKEGVDIVSNRMQNNKKPFDLIFMDINMPIMDGLEAASTIIALGIETPIVAMTANIMANDIELYKKSGIPDFLSKPFTSQELWRCLIKYLQPVSTSILDKNSSAADDIKLLKQLKMNFVKSNQTIYAEIRKALDNGDIILANRLAHTLKSNAGQIGEKQLQKIAAALENMLKHGNIYPQKVQMDILEAEINSVLEKLAPLLAESEVAKKAPPVYGEKLLQLFEQLESMLKNRNPECIKLLDKISRIPGAEELEQKIEDFDFKNAVAALSALREKMSIKKENT